MSEFFEKVLKKKNCQIINLYITLISRRALWKLNLNKNKLKTCRSFSDEIFHF